VQKYKNYEDRWNNDEYFRAAMLSCRPPRDLNFRALVDSLQINKLSTKDWKNNLAQRWHSQGWREEGTDGGDTGQAWQSRKRDRNDGRSSTASSSSSTRWSGASWWAGAATWGSQVWQAKSQAIVKRNKNAAAFWSTDGNIAFSYWSLIKMTIILILLAVVAIAAYKVYKFVTHSKFYRKAKKTLQIWLTDEADGNVEQIRYRFRSVGTMSQATHDGQRFKAYENGFRRAGEVTYENHEFWPVRNRAHVD
jgi:hypothetical protein